MTVKQLFEELEKINAIRKQFDQSNLVIKYHLVEDYYTNIDFSESLNDFVEEYEYETKDKSKAIIDAEIKFDDEFFGTAEANGNKVKFWGIRI